jgi:glycosyltransferase involved in cell wall biosynthesis
MNILQLTSTYPYDNVDPQPRFIENLAKGVSDSARVLVLAPAVKGRKQQPVCNSNLKVIRFRYFFKYGEALAGGDGIIANIRSKPALLFTVPFFICAMALAIIKTCRSERINIIHIHWLVPQGISFLLARPFLPRTYKVLVTSHGGDLFALKGSFFRFLKGKVLREADHITVVSQAMRVFLLGHFDVAESDVSVISMGVDFTKFSAREAQDKKPSSFVFVGRLVPKKGLDYLLEAFAKVVAVEKNASLTIIGGGGKLLDYEKKAELLGVESRVEFAGSVPNSAVPEYLSAASIAVFPFVVDENGDQEGLGLTVLEALASQCVVIASDMPAIHDVIEHEVNGFLVAQKDVDTLSEVMLLSLDEKNVAKIRSCARESVLYIFDWQHIVMRYSALYKLLDS